MYVDRIRDMYESGLAAQDIANQLKKSVWQVYKFMRKHGIARRESSETIKIKFLKSKLSFNLKKKLSIDEQTLHLAGLMLYWAEGYKAGNNNVDFANSNQEMALIFLKVLREIYRVEESRLRIFLYCYANQDVDELVKFWSKQLKISETQFSKPYIRQDFGNDKIGRMRYGLVHIRYSDKRLLEQIKMDIDKISKQLVGRDGRAVKYTSL